MAKRDVRQDAINSVYAVCADVGLENLTTNRISRAAGTSEAMIYYHFKNKTDILKAAFLNIHTEIDGLFRSAFAERGLALELDEKKVCLETWKVYYCYWRDNPAKTDFYDSFIHSHYISAELWNTDNASYMFFMAAFGKLMQRLADKYGHSAYIFIWSMVVESAITLAKRTVKTGDDLTPQAEEMVARILGAMLL